MEAQSGRLNRPNIPFQVTNLGVDGGECGPPEVPPFLLIFFLQRCRPPILPNLQEISQRARGTAPKKAFFKVNIPVFHELDASHFSNHSYLLLI